MYHRALQLLGATASCHSPRFRRKPHSHGTQRSSCSTRQRPARYRACTGAPRCILKIDSEAIDEITKTTPQRRRQAVHLRAEVSPDLGQTRRSAKIQQVLSNLVATPSIPSAGSVTVTAAHSSRALVSGSELRASASPATSDVYFDEFRQLMIVSRAHTGKGWLSHHAQDVDLLEGEITVESEPKEGSRSTSLPRMSPSHGTGSLVERACPRLETFTRSRARQYHRCCH